MFAHEILDVILKNTDAEIDRYLAAQPNTDESASLRIVAVNKLEAFIRLLYYLGVNKNNQLDVKELWAHDFGTILCKVMMSQRHFEFINCQIRFGDKDTRVERCASDVLAIICEIWTFLC
ncbi:unnamed protein product [Hermetia illucens]|uniref:Uncharacterized protein n=1 Tax=Hermetia illucens TaxID=343691 RepID=A0A7R8YUQ9_HERIL|nr:unnamed protein product [Hermetia illucens]